MSRGRLPLSLIGAALLACGPGEQGPVDGGGKVDLACGTDSPQVTSDRVYLEVAEPRCRICHNDATSNTLFNVQSPQALRQMVGAASAYPGEVKIIDPGDLANSTLFLKILGGSPAYTAKDGTPVGGPMPQNGSLSAEEVALFRDWICSGAQ